eukprot:5553386-Pleurochrysis_carterae.AAC.1
MPHARRCNVRCRHRKVASGHKSTDGCTECSQPGQLGSVTTGLVGEEGESTYESIRRSRQGDREEQE